MKAQHFDTLPEAALFLRQQLEDEQHKLRFVLLYAHNGTGKTRLSVEFKNIGKIGEQGDTLYFNAFTEDLFTWDNDLEGDTERALKINTASKFFSGLEDLEMDTRIKDFLDPYCDFDFRILDDRVVFSRKPKAATGQDAAGAFISNIKVSRGEEQLFKWCFFLAILRATLDGAEAYKWVQFIYIDDPVSSLDEHNAIALANRLSEMIKESKGKLKTVISTHHALFFNVLYNELKYERVGKEPLLAKFVLSQSRSAGTYRLTPQHDDTPYFQHVSLMEELHCAVQTGQLYSYHFNILRTIMEKTASFHGHGHFSVCIKASGDDDAKLHQRMLDILSHGKYSLYDPKEMTEDNKENFRQIFDDFRSTYHFNPALFPTAKEKAE
jgi:hypothetical protein